ncbi:hypothetical protein JZ751_024075 [Albula glossodonta]|uniref:Uncharacterized protein n=1 Tax=Albula glossodonta TaxID=121402 RepID=A0A8T2MQ50_9TELE|nr:hypothetical protein JZ751_024075 [Albula glossodonta]
MTAAVSLYCNNLCTHSGGEKPFYPCGNQAAGSSSEHLYSKIGVSAERTGREDEGNTDVLYSSLVLDDKKKKKKQRKKNTEGSDPEVVYSTVRTG